MAFSVSAFGLDETDLPTGWKAERLDTLVFFNPDQINGGYPHSEIAYLDIANVEAGMMGKPKELSLSEAPSRAKRIVKQNDTILSTVRPGNRAYAFLREVPANLVVSTGFAVIRAKKGVADPRFVYYLATSDSLINYLASIAEEKTAYPSVNPCDIAECVVPIPPFNEQRAIAHILGTLDDKIELNRRMNETLEYMARALFKSWFVDFDPVRAKAEGRDTGLPKHIADLFPARFVDSELGEIPEGWGLGAIGELAEVVGGSTPSTKDSAFWEGGIHHWATPKDLSALTVPVLLDTERRVTDAGLAQISSGLLPVGTILLSSRAPIGYLAVAEVPIAINQGFIAMKAQKGVSNLFLLIWARVAHEDILSRANGSTFLEISKANFRPIQTVVPQFTVFSAFDLLARPLYQRIVSNERESRVLAALRDSLLPKLISGELRIEHVERFIGRTV